MKTKHNIILTVLFAVTALIFFAPMVQQNWRLFKFKGMVGYNQPTQKPKPTFDSYQKGAYQRQSEKYLQEHFGFREPLIRMYNQCTYDLFKTTSNNDVAIEKDGWLYHTESIYQYFGDMEKRFGLSSSQVRDMLSEEARALAKVNAILKEYDVHLLTFSLPTKTFVYPEHLRRHPVGDTAFNAAEYYEQLMKACGVPHINMTSWFQQLQDTTDFDLFYSKGSHWAAGATLAVDSILRYMERLDNRHLTQIQLGEPYPISDIPWDEKDLENLLNLARPLKHEPVYEYPVTLATDDSTTFPTVWFIGTSFYWYMKRRVSFDVLFQSRDFTFYRALHYTNRESVSKPAENMDYLHELLMHDYVVFFRDGPQLHNYGFLFPGKSLIGLCISEERFNEKLAQVADSMGSRELALMHLQQHPELFEELRGEEVPSCRNPKIDLILAEKKIRADRSWSFLLNAKADNDSSDIQELFAKEARNVLDNNALLRDNVFFTSYDYFSFLLEETLTKLRQRPNETHSNSELYELALADLEVRVQQHEFDDDSLMMAACAMDAMIHRIGTEPVLSAVRTKAEERKVSIDNMFREDVIWCLHKLDDWKRFSDGGGVDKAFEYFQIERRMRLNNEVMASINQKRIEEQLPVRTAINNQVEWYFLNSKQ